jgi:hypothetical protein
MFSVDEATAVAVRRAYGGERRTVRCGRAAAALSGDCGQRECPALRACDRGVEAVACPAPKANPDMPYQIIDAVMARVSAALYPYFADVPEQLRYRRPSMTATVAAWWADSEPINSTTWTRDNRCCRA